MQRLGTPAHNQRCQVDSEEARTDRKSTRLNSSHTVISYAVFCLKKKKIKSEKGPALLHSSLQCFSDHSTDCSSWQMALVTLLGTSRRTAHPIVHKRQQ